MVNYPDLSSLPDNSTIGDFMAFPNIVYPYFWVWIIGALWLIIASTLYFTEKERVGKDDLLSSLAVSSFACMVLSVFGTLLGIISLPIMIYILVFGFMIIIIWFFSSRRN